MHRSPRTASVRGGNSSFNRQCCLRLSNVARTGVLHVHNWTYFALHLWSKSEMWQNNDRGRANYDLLASFFRPVSLQRSPSCVVLQLRSANLPMAKSKLIHMAAVFCYFITVKRLTYDVDTDSGHVVRFMRACFMHVCRRMTSLTVCIHS